MGEVDESVSVSVVVDIGLGRCRKLSFCGARLPGLCRGNRSATGDLVGKTRRLQSPTEPTPSQLPYTPLLLSALRTPGTLSAKLSTCATEVPKEVANPAMSSNKEEHMPHSREGFEFRWQTP